MIDSRARVPLQRDAVRSCSTAEPRTRTTALHRRREVPVRHAWQRLGGREVRPPGAREWELASRRRQVDDSITRSGDGWALAGSNSSSCSASCPRSARRVRVMRTTLDESAGSSRGVLARANARTPASDRHRRQHRAEHRRLFGILRLRPAADPRSLSPWSAAYLHLITPNAQNVQRAPKRPRSTALEYRSQSMLS